MSRVSILLVNWNGWGDTIECLESVFRSVPEDVRIIICDNDSTDGSVERIQKWAKGLLNTFVPQNASLRNHSWPPVPKPISCGVYDRAEAEKGGDNSVQPRLVLIKAGGNLGFAGANNVGLIYLLKQQNVDYFWLLNNDTVVAPGSSDALLDRMGSDPKIGMCGSTLLHYRNPERVQARGGGWYCKWIGLPWHIGQLGCARDSVNTAHVERWMNYVVGASLCVTRSFVEQIGLMNEEYFLFFEETDWAERSRRQFRLAYAPESVVYHKIGQSIGTSSRPSQKSYTCDFYSLRNRLLFTRRFFPKLLPIIYLSLFSALVLRALCFKWDRVHLVWRIILSSGRLKSQPGTMP